MIRLLVLLVTCAGPALGLDNGLALTPPMGWLSWQRFRCETDCKTFPDSCISEKLLMVMADRMAADGYAEAGYQFVNVDDCWLAPQRDNTTNKLVPDPDRFPSGIKALADYIHSKGLKFGIYEDFGTKTCAGFPGSEYYLQLDANTFAEWQVDMLKFDGCNSDFTDMANGYPAMSRYLNQTGRPIVFSCEWPLYAPDQNQVNYTAVRQSCNMWRNHYDVQDSWSNVLGIVDFYGDNYDKFGAYTGPGGWADPDMLVVGDFSLSYYQQKAQMAMWAMFSAPLFMSVDLRDIDPSARSLLLNRNVLAINQDRLGVQAKRLQEVNQVSFWLKPLEKKGTFALAILNKNQSPTPQLTTFTFQGLGVPTASGYNVTEVFDNVFLGSFSYSQNVALSVDPTGVLLLQLIPVD